jgi:hypothetical protein
VDGDNRENRDSFRHIKPNVPRHARMILTRQPTK